MEYNMYNIILLLDSERSDEYECIDFYMMSFFFMKDSRLQQFF